MDACPFCTDNPGFRVVEMPEPGSGKPATLERCPCRDRTEDPVPVGDDARSDTGYTS